ncbi:hypothetical protein DKX38_023053 [Salix brachista]|uniref:Uncharacterized protein n=1 Tax=Salix brachista TaxID=2182728 RepID=A0A5N5K477_9ROSI|nr:hypothetical protein DKX38_023053 [Salix brachista]
MIIKSQSLCPSIDFFTDVEGSRVENVRSMAGDVDHRQFLQEWAAKLGCLAGIENVNCELLGWFLNGKTMTICYFFSRNGGFSHDTGLAKRNKGGRSDEFEHHEIQRTGDADELLAWKEIFTASSRLEEGDMDSIQAWPDPPGGAKFIIQCGGQPRLRLG